MSKLVRFIVFGSVCIVIAVAVILWPTSSKTQTNPATAPFTVSNSTCNPVSREGLSAYHCDANINFIEANYDAYGVIFHITYADGETQHLSFCSDAHRNGPFRLNQPLHAMVTTRLVDANHQAVAVSSVTVTPDFAINTNSTVWGNKASSQIMSIGLRRAGFSEDVIAAQKGMTPVN